MVLSLTPMEETDVTRAWTDCLNFDVSYAYNLKNKFQVEEQGIGVIFFVGF